jgi:hypothetical protein
VDNIKAVSHSKHTLHNIGLRMSTLSGIASWNLGHEKFRKKHSTKSFTCDDRIGQAIDDKT